MSDGATVTYDDSKSGQVKYTAGPWYPLAATDPDNSTWQDGTLSGVNAAAAFTFTFTGSRVVVYGYLRGQGYTIAIPTESSYSIDGVLMNNYIAPQVTVDQSKVQFFDSGDIGALSHFMSVSITSATNDFPYYLDFITVVPPPPPVTTSSTPPPPPPQTTSTSPAAQQSPQSNTPPPAQIGTSAAPGTPNPVPPSSKSPASDSPQSASAQSSTFILPPQPAGGSTTTIIENGSSVAVQIAPSDPSSSSMPSPTPALAPDNSASLHTKVGPIAGGVVGGVVVLIAALVLFFLCRRHKKSRNVRTNNNNVNLIEGRVMQETGVGNGASGVTPYMLPRDYGTASAPMVPRQTAAPLAPGSVSGTTPMSPQSQLSEKARLALQRRDSYAGPAVLSEEEYPPGPPSQVSERSRYSSTVPSDYTSESKTHLLVSHRHINSASTGDADVSNYSNSSGERISSVQVEGSQSSPPTFASVPQPTSVPGPSILHADSGIRFLRRAAGNADPTYDATSILSPVPSEVPPVYTAR